MELTGLFLSCHNLFLHFDLLVEILFLKFLELTNLDYLSLVAGQRFLHR